MTVDPNVPNPPKSAPPTLSRHLVAVLQRLPTGTYVLLPGVGGLCVQEALAYKPGERPGPGAGTRKRLLFWVGEPELQDALAGDPAVLPPTSEFATIEKRWRRESLEVHLPDEQLLELRAWLWETLMRDRRAVVDGIGELSVLENKAKLRFRMDATAKTTFAAR